jgi:hypothetical protein
MTIATVAKLMGILIPYWECKLVHLLWKVALDYLVQLNIQTL